MSTSTINRLAPTQVELEIPITEEELKAAEERAFRKLVKNVRLPGFRQGKVPRKVFEQTYGAESVRSQAMEDVVPEVYAKAVREHDLEPIERPRMELLPEEPGKPTRLKATVEVRPEIKLGAYKGVPVEREPVVITDEDVEHSIQALAKDRATLVPVDRPAELGDVLTMDFEGKIDDVPFEGGTAKGQIAELDESRFIPGFATGIVGMKSGDTREINVTFPENYSAENLAGKDAVFSIAVHDVKAYELPAIDDEFAKSISDNQSLDGLREDVRKRLTAMAEGRGRRVIGNALMEKLIDAHDFALPDTMVDREIDHMVEEAASNAAQSGQDFEAYLEEQGKTRDDLREMYRDAARTRVKGTLIIEAVAKAENIQATPADIAEELQSLARQYGQPVDRIRKALGNNVLSLMDGILRNKTLEFLIDNAKVTDAKS